MTRVPAALALLALLSKAATAEPCTPRVQLDGDRDAVARVAVELTQLGIVLGAASSTNDRACSVSAMVTTDGEGISVAVQNAAKRSEGRSVRDPKVAAAWIDSWLRDEIEVASWASPEIDNIDEPPAVSSAPAITPPGASPLSADRSPLESFGLSVVAERSWTDDHTEWNGFDVAGCMRVGAVCLGARLRAVFQPELELPTTTAKRSDIVALATVAMPFTLGQISIAPELGLGVGRTRTQRIEACAAPPPSMDQPEPNTPGCMDPTDPMCTMTPDDPITSPGSECLDAQGLPTNEIYVGDDYDKVTYLPRVAVALRFAFPIVHHVWLDALASYTLTPIPERTGFDENAMTGPTAAMPLAPSHGYQLGVGIRVGIP